MGGTMDGNLLTRQTSEISARKYALPTSTCKMYIWYNPPSSVSACRRQKGASHLSMIDSHFRADTYARWALNALVCFAACQAGLNVAAQSNAPSLPAAAKYPLRVNCRTGQPPFTSMDATTGQCTGLLVDLTNAALQGGYDFAMKPINTGNAESRVAVNATTGQSTDDLFLAFIVVTPARQRIADFTPTVMETDFKVLTPRRVGAGQVSLASSILRESVMHIMGLLMLLAWGAGMLYFVIESLHSDPIFADEPAYKRLMYCFTEGVELVLTQGGGDFNSQLCLLVKAFISVATLFLVAIFGALVTSKLTVSSLSDAPLTLKDCRNQKIGASGSLTPDFLKSDAVAAIPVTYDSPEAAADDMILNGNPKGLFGVITATPSVDYLIAQYATQGVGHLKTTEPFFLTSNTYDIRALPMSKALPRNVSDDITVRFITKRDDGTLANLVAKYIGDASTGSTEAADVVLPSVELLGVRIACIVLFVSTMIAVFVAYLWNWMRDQRQESPPPSRGDVDYDYDKRSGRKGRGDNPLATVHEQECQQSCDACRPGDGHRSATPPRSAQLGVTTFIIGGVTYQKTTSQDEARVFRALVEASNFTRLPKSAEGESRSTEPTAVPPLLVSGDRRP